MKTLADWNNGKCKNEIVKIENGYLLRSYSIWYGNKGYDVCRYYSDANTVFNAFRDVCYMANEFKPAIEYEFESIEW